MRIVRFLIIALFVLSVSLSAAPARAAGPSTGYIALVTQARPNMPLATQARSEFQRLAPALMAAKESGYLVDFKPEFRAGIVILRFGTRAGAAALAAGILDRPVYGSSRDALNTVPYERPARAGQVSAAVITANFWVDLYGDCFWADVPADSHVIATLKDGSGNLLTKAEFNEQDDGVSGDGIYNCLDAIGVIGVEPGFQVRFKVYDAPGGSLLGSFAATAPTLKFSTLNKSTAVVTGTGPANKHFWVYWNQPKLNAANQWIENGVDGTISSGGAWSQDVWTGSIRGGAYVEVGVVQTAHINFVRSMSVPFIFCQLGDNACQIWGFPFQTLTLKLTKGSTTYTFSGQADGWGWLAIRMRTSSGTAILVKSGNQVQGTGVALFTQPSLAINAFNFVNDVVSGNTPANKFFDVFVQTYSAGEHLYWAGSNGSGVFSVDTTLDFDLLDTETSRAGINYTNPSTGNASLFIRSYAP